MKVLHISAECYPAAKAGGLGDVVGALPKYLNKADVTSAVIIPKYYNKWMNNRHWTEDYRGSVRLHQHHVPFSVQMTDSRDLGYPLYVVDIPGLFDRPGVYAGEDGYAYRDETERYLCFQQAVLQWIIQFDKKPEVLHCHDHHTGLIPFMVKHCPEYRVLSNTPTVFTIHNGNYHGAFSWSKIDLMPLFDSRAGGLLDWANTIDPLTTGIKCCWRLTTVSPEYLNELKRQSGAMATLLQSEADKSVGILNGIDTQVWNPVDDNFIHKKLNGSVQQYKTENKRAITDSFGLNPNLPLVVFIGRLAKEKGADMLPDLIEQFLRAGNQATFAMLGTGDPQVEQYFSRMNQSFPGNFKAILQYNEGLAHQLYAAGDFLLMPSRVEPCGLNQLYAFRYGTVPIVRRTGGLQDTVVDAGEPHGSGSGLCFSQFTVDDAWHALYRATELYQNKATFNTLQRRIMKLNFSWEESTSKYLSVYRQIANI